MRLLCTDISMVRMREFCITGGRWVFHRLVSGLELGGASCLWSLCGVGCICVQLLSLDNYQVMGV